MNTPMTPSFPPAPAYPSYPASARPPRPTPRRRGLIRRSLPFILTFALGVGVGASGSCIQLLAPLSPESTIAKFLDRNGQGIQQLAYRVEDIDAVCATLRERGLRLLYDTPKRGTSNSRVNFIHPKDARGILVELVEPAASAAH